MDELLVLAKPWRLREFIIAEPLSRFVVLQPHRISYQGPRLLHIDMTRAFHIKEAFRHEENGNLAANRTVRRYVLESSMLIRHGSSEASSPLLWRRSATR